MTIGLTRGSVKLLPHQQGWKEAAEATISTLRRVFGEDAAYAHVGSTAIPSIKAKPILDILVGVNDYEDVLAKVDELERAGFVYRQDNRPRELLFCCGDFEHEFITHHIHVILYGTKQWWDYLHFRDYLLAHEEEAKAYEALKEELAAKYENYRPSYTAGKAEFIQTILDKADKEKA